MLPKVRFNKSFKMAFATQFHKNVLRIQTSLCEQLNQIGRVANSLTFEILRISIKLCLLFIMQHTIISEREKREREREERERERERREREKRERERERECVCVCVRGRGIVVFFDQLFCALKN